MGEDEDFRARTLGQPHVSSRPLTLEVRIPQNHAGLVIGRGGQNIKEIQTRSNTRIHFKDELSTEEYRFLSISGLPDDVKLAEILIHQIIANQPTTETFEMYIPSTYIGPIIGRNGESIRSLQDRSGCRIDIERRPLSDTNDRKVVLRGNPNQIKMARTFIEDIVRSLINERQLFGNHKQQPLFLTSDPAVNGDSNHQHMKTTLEYEELITNQTDAIVEVYVCSISDPSCFYVQKVGPTSVALDKLGQDMTSFYDQNSESMKLDKVEKGTIVATKNLLDGTWYRAKVTNIVTDEYDDSIVDVEVDFVDFGDYESKSIQELCQIKQEFLKLKFQAIPASMAEIKPIKSSKWSPEAIDDFESLTHAAQWKPLLAHLINIDESVSDVHIENKPEPKCRAYLKLIDANSDEDIDIGEEMIQRGYAVTTTPEN